MGLLGCNVILGYDEGQAPLGGTAGSGGSTTPSGGAGGAGGAGAAGGEAGGGGGDDSSVLTFGERATSTYQDVTFDTQLMSSFRDFNYGASPTGWADDSPNERRVTLIRFDLTLFPATAAVAAAALRVCTGDDPQYSSSVGTVELYRVLESWEEGTEGGSAGVANWDDREPDTAWTTPGAGPGSHHSVEVGSFQGAEVGTEYVVPLPTELVEGWLADPDSNYGLVATTASTDGTEIVLSEHVAADCRPELAITVMP
ncbi:MAG: DNRLRE domain-containing protein [Deltaproteobacteria bacterium]|nr:DNRLRE domain-containing protein [Deltaproteobacteria bacterium]MBW2537560.1 DNRLRE domain-containing protein [Deltaproteobacteria bacterium]